MRNLGEKSSEWLLEIGVSKRSQIEAIGSVEIYRRLRQVGIPASLNLVYALEASILDIDWRELAPEAKVDLKQQIADLNLGKFKKYGKE